MVSRKKENKVWILRITKQWKNGELKPKFLKKDKYKLTKSGEKLLEKTQNCDFCKKRNMSRKCL